MGTIGTMESTKKIASKRSLRSGLMGRTPLSTRFTTSLLCTGLLTAGLLLTGCKDFNKKSMDQAQRDAQAQTLADAVHAQAARLEAIRMQEALRRQQEPAVVTWLNEDLLHRQDKPQAQSDNANAAANAENDARVAAAAAAVTSAANATVEPVKHTAVAEPVPEQVSVESLLTQLLLTQRREQGDAVTRAVNIAAILGMTGKEAFDPRDLQALSDPQKTRLQHYQKLTALLREQAISPGNATQYQTMLEHLDALMDDVPLHIRKVEIARSVSSFGVYQAMETRTFLAGRPQPMIVYVELEHFKAIKGDAGKYAVKLAQELVLYNEADGLAIWREPRVQISDESLNRRRDFFVVQRIELPARLGVGKYLLKVTMSDLQGGSIDETTVPIQVVADVTMVKKP